MKISFIRHGQIVPAVLFDRDGILNNSIDKLKKRVKEILGGKLPSYIPREEKIVHEILQRIKESFIL